MTQKGAQAPFRINFIALGSAHNVDIQARVNSCDAPYARKRTQQRLAVVGLGESSLYAINELREWDGDIWAINGAAAWLADKGIVSTMVTVDPLPFPDFAFHGISSALFASCADPSAFEQMRDRVEKFDMIEHSDTGVIGSCTTATRMPALAVSLGYTDVTFFGCEGSFTKRNHVDSERTYPEQLIINADGVDYVSVPEFVLQAQSLASVMREWPDIFKEKSGGLLRGMILDQNWSVVAVSSALKGQIEEISGSHGLYEMSYQFNKEHGNATTL